MTDTASARTPRFPPSREAPKTRTAVRFIECRESRANGVSTAVYPPSTWRSRRGLPGDCWSLRQLRRHRIRSDRSQLHALSESSTGEREREVEKQNRLIEIGDGEAGDY